MRRALAFLTPVGASTPPTPGAVAWFPVVGAALGLVLGGVWWAAAQVWPAAVAAAVVVAADLGLTGLLHLDGLVDAADGLIPPLDRGRRLDVMADPAAGAFGVGVAVVVLLLRWTALASMRPHALVLAGLWCASRSAMALTMRAVPYARPTGLATAFMGGGSAVPAVAGLVAAAAIAGVGVGISGPAAVAAVVFGAAAVVALARRRIGGFTGDVLGAAGMVGETAGLLVAAARW